MSKKKKFRMIDAILLVICVVFVAEAAAPVAAIGNSQYFWWILLMLIFLLPYGLISSELGTTYDGDGGLYDWVRKAFGSRMGSRASWYYWINFPLWMASLAVVFPDMITLITGIEIGTVDALIIELIFIWIIVFISFFPVSDSVWILNGAAVIKVFLAVLLGGLGIYVALTQGVANEITASSLLPSFDLDSLSYVSVILFNMLGFEVICTLSGDMENPNKQIPKAIIIGGFVIAGIYMFSAFGIGVAIPTSEISTSSGLVDAIILMTNEPTGLLVKVSAVLFLLTLFGNMISWSLGVNSVACYAAKNGDMPKVFAKESKKNGMPTGTAIMNGVIASIVVLLAPLIPNQDLFWSFFALNLVMFLLAYIPIFPAFLKLRKIDPDTERPFRVKGSDLFLKVLALCPMVVIIVALIFTAVPLSFDSATLEATLPITIGAIIFILIGEFICRRNKTGQPEEEKQ
ncbi:amino acid transporter [Breznakia sp. PF5-3]|uniref:APC family permease n=1 Tax=unclassified Breznakia TaxID=2623764 RepID=UPI002407022C|nr:MULTISPECIES: APC family permease [unclassified Breznakia]MDL2276537.1 APC family permease [Breznakia sp. OttesenSCG-928-G09]MDF9824607.1 amino acid transporter [Breznakia sp. PM6-1]MDF9835543.1 amino acid transporter [Breznakia sp. PF5-3]MDF9837955.1 amino acid transporter [Breznakia sp. PFB2-8]MDF9859944.1 amino acid transporter [Breznakia sp. PH5-24]